MKELTQEFRNEILESIRHGIPIETAAAAAGVSSITLDAWRKSGSYRVFFFEMENVEEQCYEGYLEIVRNTAKSGKKGAQRWLKKWNL